MAKKKDDASSQGPLGSLSRREFLWFTGAASALLAACGPGALGSDDSSLQALEGVPPDYTKVFYRAEDMLYLTFKLFHFRIDGSPAKLRRKPGQPQQYIVVTLP